VDRRKKEEKAGLWDVLVFLSPTARRETEERREAWRARWGSSERKG
jgi:hypothetical protein